MDHTSPIVIGGGLAGLLTALSLPEPVRLLVPGVLGDQTSSAWAQGGVAVSLGADDSAALHVQDTLAAGDGLVAAESAARIVQAGPALIDTLLTLGTQFDRDAQGALALGLEAAHARRRIVHAQGDGTGREIVRALVQAVRATPRIQIVQGQARRLLLHNGAVCGVLAATNGGALLLPGSRVVIATGGVGALFEHTTNPAGSWGSGLALALRAGAMLMDPEFVQFHPTALDAAQLGGFRPLPLVSEAVRGEGATLIDENGDRFMAHVPGGELAPRDVVARAIWRHSRQGRRCFLNARGIAGFARRFPGIDALCREAGIDAQTQPIPVRPAAHYHMGGIAVDAAGRSSVRGLWACGEAACTGLHGANRLASNSLLEAGVCAGTVAADVAADVPRVARVSDADLPPAPAPDAVRPVLSAVCGVLRDEDGLRNGVARLLPQIDDDAALVALATAVAALQRRESRGAHHRTDYPMHASPAVHTCITLDHAVQTARALAAVPA